MLSCRLRELNPDMLINQPTYGFPQIEAEISVINESWDSEGNSNNIADSIGIMVYTPVSRSCRVLEGEGGILLVAMPIYIILPPPCAGSQVARIH